MSDLERAVLLAIAAMFYLMVFLDSAGIL